MTSDTEPIRCRKYADFGHLRYWLGSGLIVYGAVLIGFGTLWTIAIPVAMAIIVVCAATKVILAATERRSIRALTWASDGSTKQPSL